MGHNHERPRLRRATPGQVEAAARSHRGVEEAKCHCRDVHYAGRFELLERTEEVHAELDTGDLAGVVSERLVSL